MEKPTRRLSRRNFIRSLGAGGAAAAAALVANRTEQDSTEENTAARDSRGYQESAHVRNYYRTAKV